MSWTYSNPDGTPIIRDGAPIRFAAVINAESAERLYRFMPENYKILAGIDGTYLIGGADRAGWTLQGYVIPRLSSGNIQAIELLPNTVGELLAGPADGMRQAIENTFWHYVEARQAEPNLPA